MSDRESFARQVSCDTISHHITNNSPPQGGPSHSDITIQTELRAFSFVEKGPSQEKLYRNGSVLGCWSSKATTSQLSKAEDSNSPTRTMLNQDNIVVKWQEQDHPISGDDQHRTIHSMPTDTHEWQKLYDPVSEDSRRQVIHSTPINALARILATHQPNTAVSLYGSAPINSGSVWPRHNTQHNYGDRPLHTRASMSFTPSIASKLRDDSSSPTPCLPAADPRKRKTPYFDAPLTSFGSLSRDAQLSARRYLEGEPAVGWARDLGMSVMDMFTHLRCCVLLLCEDENPGLAPVLRDAGAYARLRDGLNANFLAPDDAFVRALRDRHTLLNARLRDAGQRCRIVLAVRTVDFPAVVLQEEAKDALSRDGDGEEVKSCKRGLDELVMSI